MVVRVIIFLVPVFILSVLSASAGKVRLGDSPTPVDVITKDDLDKGTTTTLKELMQQAPKVNRNQIQVAQAQGSKPSRSEIKAKAKQHGDTAYKRSIELGFTKKQAARDAGFAAGRRAARLGASPYDASGIAEREVRSRGGTVKDTADAASYAAAEAGGGGYSIGYAIRAVVWDTFSSLEYQLRNLLISYQSAISEKDRKRLKKELDAKSAELGGWLDYLIRKAAKDTRDAGGSPEEEGRAIGAALISMDLTFFDVMTAHNNQS